MNTNLEKLGELNGWPVYKGFPLRPHLASVGVVANICTHWQCSVTAYASRKSKLEQAIKDAIALAISGLEKCAKTPDPDGLRAYALSELRAGRPALVPHPVDLRNAKAAK